MRDRDDLSDLPILRELGMSLRVAAAREDDRMHRLVVTRARRRRRLTLSSVGVASVAAAVVAVSSTIGGPGTESASAATTLNEVARVAAGQPDELPAPDQYFYVRSRVSGVVLPGSASGDQRPLRTSDVRQIWQSLERPGRLLTTALDGGTATPTPGNGQEGSIPAQRTYQLGSIRLSPEALKAFPTDPAEIYARFRGAVEADGRGSSPDAQVFDDIVQALGEQPAPARLRGGLYRALALVRGVEVTSSTPAETTVALDVAGVRHEASFDPDTAELLATRDTPEGAAGRDTSTRTVYEERAITSKLIDPAD